MKFSGYKERERDRRAHPAKRIVFSISHSWDSATSLIVLSIVLNHVAEATILRVPFRRKELRPDRDGWVMSWMRLARACHAQSQTRIVQGIQEAGHVVVSHPQTAWRPTAKGRLGDIEKVMQASLV
jgi:hypothetical protein